MKQDEATVTAVDDEEISDFSFSKGVKSRNSSINGAKNTVLVSMFSILLAQLRFQSKAVFADIHFICGQTCHHFA